MMEVSGIDESCNLPLARGKEARNAAQQQGDSSPIGVHVILWPRDAAGTGEGADGPPLTGEATVHRLDRPSGLRWGGTAWHAHPT